MEVRAGVCVCVCALLPASPPGLKALLGHPFSTGPHSLEGHYAYGVTLGQMRE